LSFLFSNNNIWITINPANNTNHNSLFQVHNINKSIFITQYIPNNNDNL